ncbi:hypothetical protein [Gracilibacillus phocaeensis]|nr:hypothetical protein [Gracilibacillus phocaeensis]
MNDEINRKEREKNKRKTIHEEKRSKLDQFKEQQFVDETPLEDQKIDRQNEKDKKNSQSTSQSEKKYKEN